MKNKTLEMLFKTLLEDMRDWPAEPKSPRTKNDAFSLPI